MNRHILDPEIQSYIDRHLDEDVNRIALAKPAFDRVSQGELAGQIAAKKKAKGKLPRWFDTANIIYPSLLSMEQCSSEPTAAYKADLALGESLIDLTAGFGVDTIFFSEKLKNVVSCEIDPQLSAITAHNAERLNCVGIEFVAGDGIAFLKKHTGSFDTIYIDPVRRSGGTKVFKFADCSPNVIELLDLLLNKAKRLIVKASPLVDITAGLSELRHVKEIHIISVKNECKELLWVIEKDVSESPMLRCAAINDTLKTLSFKLNELSVSSEELHTLPKGFLYEPDAAVLKSGAFNFLAFHYGLKKLHQHSHLYCDENIKTDFAGRIFAIEEVFSLHAFKKIKNIRGNVIVRNFPGSAEELGKKYKIRSDKEQFIIFTRIATGFVVIKAHIVQYY